ncbi:hypothetical protein [Lysinibacillus sp. FSL L8-0126]|uniref:hypothetical protein n=1 Tax=Lysinibacillus sp. FSL L8-0126 TaxID=2921515 RepID=UPI00315A2865
MSYKHINMGCCQKETNSFPKIIAIPGPVPTPNIGVLSYGSIRGDSLEIISPIAAPIPFQQVGPLSNVTVSPSGNELVVQSNGVYQIAISINAQTTVEPDPLQSYFTVSITVNGQPIFLDGLAIFNVLNRSSSTYVVQASLSAGDLVGVSASSANPIANYANRFLSIIQLS